MGGEKGNRNGSWQGSRGGGQRGTRWDPAEHLACARLPLRVRIGEQLRGRLAKLCNLLLHRRTGDGVLDGLKLQGALVCRVIEHVTRLDRSTAPLVGAEHKVDPKVQVLARMPGRRTR